MNKQEKYPNMYFMNNSGIGKFREIEKGEYFSIIQPSYRAVGDGAATYNHAILFKDRDEEGLVNQVNRFLGKNQRNIDFRESNRLVNIISNHKSRQQFTEEGTGNYAEISKGSEVYGIPIAKATRNAFIGPDRGTRWGVYGEDPGNVLQGKDKNADPLSYVWWN